MQKRQALETLYHLERLVSAVKDAGVDFAKEDPYRCGVLIGSGIGGIETLEEQNKVLMVSAARAYEAGKRITGQDAIWGIQELRLRSRGGSADLRPPRSSATTPAGASQLRRST